MTEKLAILVAFCALLIYLAYRSWRRTRQYEDFNLAGRDTGFFRMVATLGAAEFNTATLVGGASVVYLYGTVGIYYTSVLFVFVFGIYAVTVAKPYRRLGLSTIAEFFDRRYQGGLSESTRMFASLLTLTFTWIVPSTYLAGLSVITSVLLGVDPLTTVVCITSFCLVLALSGGLLTAISFDVVAYVMILIFVPLLLAISYVQAGGFGALSTVFEQRYLSFVPVWDLEEYGFAAILTWCFQNVLAYVSAPWYGQRIFAARSERIAYRAMLVNTVLITLLYASVALVTMFSRVLMPDLAEPEQALPRLILNYFPPILQGLILVTLLLVGSSTMIAIWNSAVSIATNDIIKRYVARNRTDRFYLNISRIIFVVLGISTLLFALIFVGNILLSLTYVSVYMTLLAFPILAGLYWRRFSTRAAFASLVVGASYVTIALAAGMPYYLISPVGVALGVFAGAGVTLVLDRGRCVPPEVDAFFASAHGQRERPVSRRWFPAG